MKRRKAMLPFGRTTKKTFSDQERGRKAPFKTMEFLEYQTESRRTAIYPDAGNNMAYPVLGLCGEAGEVAEKVKKVMRDKGGYFDHESRAAIKKELGDVLWYVAQIVSELNFDMNEVAQSNLDKLHDRMKRGKIKGDGDNR